MSPHDPRHGTGAGYQAHRRDNEDPCPPCRAGQLRTRKRQQLDRLAGDPLTYTADQVMAVASPWLALGLGPSAIAVAAGLESGRGASILTRPMRRTTYRAIAAITEDDFHPRAKVWSHLTEQRIGSLMADGHMVTDMPINLRGQWRYRDRVSVAVARSVRDHYQQYAEQPGPSAHTRARARATGRRPPIAWDDPDTLAWPLGWSEPIERVDVDPVVVARVVAGDVTLPTTRAERAEVVAHWRRAGRSLNELARLTGWKPDRYYQPGSDVA